MAITMTWSTHTVEIPRADMTLVETSPEVRELDMYALHKRVRELQASAPGAAKTRTHVHNTEQILGGVAYARQVRFLAPYNVTFEDGQYAVRLVGANNNLEEVMNLNQVSLRSSNSAGLVNAGLTDEQFALLKKIYALAGGNVVETVVTRDDDSGDILTAYRDLYDPDTPSDVDTETNRVERHLYTATFDPVTGAWTQKKQKSLG